MTTRRAVPPLVHSHSAMPITAARISQAGRAARSRPGNRRQVRRVRRPHWQHLSSPILARLAAEGLDPAWSDASHHAPPCVPLVGDRAAGTAPRRQTRPADRRPASAMTSSRPTSREQSDRPTALPRRKHGDRTTSRARRMPTAAVTLRTSARELVGCRVYRRDPGSLAATSRMIPSDGTIVHRRDDESATMARPARIARKADARASSPVGRRQSVDHRPRRPGKSRSRRHDTPAQSSTPSPCAAPSGRRRSGDCARRRSGRRDWNGWSLQPPRRERRASYKVREPVNRSAP